MLVIHASWLKGRLCLWAECSARKQRESPNGFPPILPFDAGRLTLGALVSVLAGSAKIPRARHARFIQASLPADQNGFHPSRSILLPLAATSSEFSVQSSEFSANGGERTATITVLPISVRETEIILFRCLSAGAPYKKITSKIMVGADIFSLAVLWRFATVLAIRQSFVPSIENRKSRWQPVLNTDDIGRFRTFISAVPVSASCIDGAEKPKYFAEKFFYDAFDCIMRRLVSTQLSRLHASRSSFDDVHSAWLASLMSPSSLIRWKNIDEIDAFDLDLRKWKRPLISGASNGYRLAFRLVDPADPCSHTPFWKLIPLVICPGSNVVLSAETLATLKPSIREHILVSLGQASLIFPYLSAIGNYSKGEVVLDAAGVSTFLKNTAPLLVSAGYSIFSPTWWQDQDKGAAGHPSWSSRVRIRAKLADRQKKEGFFSLDAIVNVKWELVLGDDTLSKSDIEKILSEGRPLVRWNSRWIYADRQQLQAALEKFGDLSSRQITGRSLARISFGADFSNDDVEIDLSDIEKQGHFAKLIGELKGDTKLSPVTPPTTFHGTLRPYQERGLSWLAFLNKWRFGACLADDMGLGKTIEVISALLHLRQCGDTGKWLVVCPMSIMTKWAREIARFAPDIKAWIDHGHDRPHSESFKQAVDSADVTITNYQILCRDYTDFSSVNWGTAVIDEAQNIKNPSTSKSKCVRKLNADWRIAMTGTPVENNAGDLWAIMDFLNSGLLRTRSDFNTTFLKPIQLGIDSDAKNRLRKLTSPFILRRLKTDREIVADLPPRIEEKVYCTLSHEQAELYSAEIGDIGLKISKTRGKTRRGAILALLTRLKQICNHPEHYFASAQNGITIPHATDECEARSGKLNRLDTMLEEIMENGEASLIFTQYTVMGNILQAHLRKQFGFDAPFLHGGIPVSARDEMISRFQKEDGPPVFILSLKAGGTGLDLTRASHVFHFDRWWNPAVENQATDRAHRIGQKKTVFVHTFICEGTLESRIDDLITGKTELARDLIGTGDSWIADLSDEELKEVLALSANAVTESEEGEE